MQKLFAAGVLLTLAGFFLVFAGSTGPGNVSMGGVVFFGPFPIVFGSGPSGGILALVSVVIGGVIVIGFLLWTLRTERNRRE